jgi:acyl transferase domain-containing protein/NAD(P)-dependent dehydrogenase (short-subunit alcohol dehydrogenase family)
MKASSSNSDTDLGLTFTFPGQGSYSQPVLRELYRSFPQTVPYFERADEISRELLQGEFLSLVTADSNRIHDERLEACPNLDQVGIYLTEVLIAKLLIDAGVRPALLVGHSFGELAALATAGVYSIETGLRIVCQRVLALKAGARPGVMAAVSCDLEQMWRHLEAAKTKTLEISVVNQPRQTVVSGERSEIDALETVANQQGVSVTLLKSRFAYHSSFLEGAVEPFRQALESCEFRSARFPVYLCLEGVLYSPGTDLVQALSSQFVRSLNFQKVVETLYASGYRTFIECGAGNIVSKLIDQNLGKRAEPVRTIALTSLEGTLRDSLAQVTERFGTATADTIADKVKPASAVEAAERLLEGISLVGRNMSQLVENAKQLVEQVTRTEAVHAGHSQKSASVEMKNEPPNEPLSALQVNGQGPRIFPEEKCTELPIAIVSIGCILPGAYDPGEYWSNILNGVSGISSITDNDPSSARDFLVSNGSSQIQVVSDKTYTLLHGSITEVPYDATLLAPTYTKEEFDELTKGQKLLALSLAQSLTNISSKNSLNRLQCILGATADGSKEYDDAVFYGSVQNLLGTLDEPKDLCREFGGILENITSYKPHDHEKLTQHKIYQAVVKRVVGGVPAYVVDTACSSSLYSVYLGMRGLQDGDCDLVLAGGVFAPGPANNTLFAQFRGLAQRESRPFDVAAEGVVFGDGAAIIALKRLPDALKDGDRILAVIRGMGLSSDGKSPSINVPQAKGQAIAIRKAYESSSVDITTIQYVEAHATATTVGDAVEFRALKEVMKQGADSPPLELGSVKALIGHTGWVAGAASIIKICKAFEEKTVPRQYNYESPSPEIELAGSQFTVSKASHSWPTNRAGYPRRAAINGFGFGGTNAHLILEEFDDGYHRNLCKSLKLGKTDPGELAVISVASLFPGEESTGHKPSSKLRFARKSLRLPPGKMLLPDVTEHMDPSQFLAALAAAKAFEALPSGWEQFKGDMGVVLGLESKTQRGMSANERIFLDRLRRQILESGQHQTLSIDDRKRILDKLTALISTRNVPSGPYTLPGLMPNVTAGRIANMFDLNGPNIVVDAGPSSLLQGLFVARQLLTHNDCRLVLAGGVNANAADQPHEAEAAFLLALTTVETARRQGIPILCTLRMIESGERVQTAPQTNLNYKGAQGGRELLTAIEGNQQLTLGGDFAGRSVVVNATANEAAQVSNPGAGNRSHAYVQGTPICHYTPRFFPAPATGQAGTLSGKKILFVTDQPELWLGFEQSGVLKALDYRVVCSAEAKLAQSVPLDLTSDESIRRSLEDTTSIDFDIVIPVRSLAGRSREELLRKGAADRQWLELLFGVCRHYYEQIQRGNIPVIALCLTAFRDEHLDPYTGLASGFMKSLSRELEGTICRIVNTDESNLYKALRHVELELGEPSSAVEICYRNGARSTFALVPLDQLALDSKPDLDSNSVVIATGGARGVTAVLIEELLEKFGCRVIALGRTDPRLCPEHIQRMDDQEIDHYEAQFYKDEMGRDRTRKITDLKKEYRAIRAAHEVFNLTKQLNVISGKYEYQTVDITNPATVEEVVARTYQKYGRVNLILHGAGIQVSKALPRKSIEDFRKVIATKLDGLSNLYNACEKYRGEHPVHFHILTSAFSYMGNDGQSDYGAANEAMSRLADCLNNSPEDSGHWSAMAWLGWAGIGMTRDSEFAALAAARRLRGVTKDEGKKIFAALMQGAPATPINVMLAEGEIDYYKVAINAALARIPAPVARPKNQRDFCVSEREVSVASAPYLVNHLVDNVPTLPGAYVIAVFADAALELRPDLKIISFEKASFRRFIKVYESRKTRLRVEARIVSEDDAETLIRVRILSDFVHGSGLILQKDVLQHEILVRMAAAIPALKISTTRQGFEGQFTKDPYVVKDSSVLLSGPFDAIGNLKIGVDERRADFSRRRFTLLDAEQRARWSTIILMDSLWRFGVINRGPDFSMPVFVPEACEVMKIFFDFAEFDVSRLRGDVMFSGANPRPDGERLHMGPVEAVDANGNVLVLVERGICRRFGEVSIARALYSQAPARLF